MNHQTIIEVKKNLKDKFRVLVNGIQEGCELSSAALANIKAQGLTKNYPAAIVKYFYE